MKKKLFLVVAMVALMVCALAISASAVQYEGIEYTLSGDTASVGNNQSYSGDGVIVIPEKITYEEVEYPVTAISDSAFSDNGAIKSFTATSISTVGNKAFYNCTAIESIDISGPLTKIGHQAFRTCDVLESLTLTNTNTAIDATATTVDYYCSAECPVLDTVIIGGKFAIGSNMFTSCSLLTTVKLLDGVNSIGASAFTGCNAITSIFLADSITTIGDNALMTQGSALTFVDENGNMDNYLPTSLTTINGHFLKNTTITNTALIFPESYTNSSSNYDFEGMGCPSGFKLIFLGKLTNLDISQMPRKDYVIYLTKNSASDVSNHFAEVYVNGTSISDNGGVYSHTNANGSLTFKLSGNINNGIDTSHLKIYFCGSDEVCFFTRRQNIRNESEGWDNYITAPVTYEQATNAGLSFDKHPIIDDGTYFAPTCEATGGTKYLCVGCGGVDRTENEEGALGHNLDTSNGALLIAIAYDNGYDKEGYKKIGCARCDKIDTSSKVNAIYTHKGYSYKLNGASTGIWSAFEIDTDALNEYEATNATTLTFGMIILNPSYLGDNFFENGVLTSTKGALQVEMVYKQYSNFNCYITGFEKDSALTSLELVIAGYAYEGDDTANITLMQKSYAVGEDAPVVSKVTKTDATLYTVSIANVQTNVALPEEIKEYGVTE